MMAYEVPIVNPNLGQQALLPADLAERGFDFNRKQITAQREDQAFQQQQQQQNALKEAFQQADTSTPEGQQDLIRKVGKINPQMAMDLSTEFGKQAQSQALIGKEKAQTVEAEAKTAETKQKTALDLAAQKKEDMTGFLGDATQALSNISQIIPDNTILPGTSTYKERMDRANKMVDEWAADMKLKYHDSDIQGILQKIDSHDWQTADEFRNHLGMFQKLQQGAKQQAPLTNVGKANAAIASGEVTPQQGQALIARETAPTNVQIQMGDQGRLSSDDMAFMAKQYLAGDTSVMQNLGRGVQGSRNIVALRREIRNQAEQAGESPEQVATRIAEFQGLKAEERATGTRAAQLGIAGNAAFNMAGMVTDASAKVNRTKLMPVNKALLAYEKNSGDPDVVAYGAALTSFINAYGRAINPTGTATVADKDHAREMLSTAQSHDQIVSVINQLKKEIEAEKKAIGQTKQDIRERTGPQKEEGPKKLIYDPATGSFK
jgi:hypothetical protein